MFSILRAPTVVETDRYLRMRSSGNAGSALQESKPDYLPRNDPPRLYRSTFYNSISKMFHFNESATIVEKRLFKIRKYDSI